MIETLHFISIALMLGIGSLFDIYNNRKIPLNLFYIPTGIGLAILVTNFDLTNFSTIIFVITLAVLYDVTGIWKTGDTIAFSLIGLHYGLLAFPILIIASLFAAVFWPLYAYNKGIKSFHDIIRLKVPFYPNLLFGFLLMHLIIFV